ncbi:MAG: hypothetical protein QM775_23810 [Pirellulales bacterium]
MGSGDRSAAVGGFYTVVSHEQHGLFGGLLLLNRNGRPLEFHCTAPIKPNRAQEILYGASLESYLHGEAIGAALLAKASTPPTFLCVESPAALAVREFTDAPVAMIVADVKPDADDRPLFRVDAAHERGLHSVTFGVRRLALTRSVLPRTRSRWPINSPHCPNISISRSRSCGFAAPSKKRSGAADERRRCGR